MQTDSSISLVLTYAGILTMGEWADYRRHEPLCQKALGLFAHHTYHIPRRHTWCPLHPPSSSFGLSHLLSFSLTNVTHIHIIFFHISAVQSSCTATKGDCRKRLCMTGRPGGGQCMEPLLRSIDGQVPENLKEATLRNAHCTQCGGSGRLCATWSVLSYRLGNVNHGISDH